MIEPEMAFCDLDGDMDIIEDMIKYVIRYILENAKDLYDLNGYELYDVPGHEGGRNLVYVCVREGEPEYVLRLSMLGDREKEDYLAEAEFIHYLAVNGAPVTDVIPSSNGNFVESFSSTGEK